MPTEVIFEQGDYGKRAILRGPWSSAVEDLLLSADIDELELNQGKGWRGDGLAFLRHFGGLKAFLVLDFHIRDISSIHALHELVHLNISTYCNTPIDFSQFPKLKRCFFEWRAGSTSVFARNTLNRFSINHYSGADAAPFGRLTNLEDLTILNSPIKTLAGLAPLSKLKRLDLALLRRLDSLDGLQSLANLEELKISTCRKVKSIQQIRGLRKLKRLMLDNIGDIDSLSPISELKALEWVTFIESTNILDGDLTPLTKLGHLSNVGYMNRRHYSHKREQFGEAFFGPPRAARRN